MDERRKDSHVYRYKEGPSASYILCPKSYNNQQRTFYTAFIPKLSSCTALRCAPDNIVAKRNRSSTLFDGRLRTPNEFQLHVFLAF
jgi:hypothetical protein